MLASGRVSVHSARSGPQPASSLLCKASPGDRTCTFPPRAKWKGGCEQRLDHQEFPARVQGLYCIPHANPPGCSLLRQPSVPTELHYSLHVIIIIFSFGPPFADPLPMRPIVLCEKVMLLRPMVQGMTRATPVVHGGLTWGSGEGAHLVVLRELTTWCQASNWAGHKQGMYFNPVVSFQPFQEFLYKCVHVGIRCSC